MVAPLSLLLRKKKKKKTFVCFLNIGNKVETDSQLGEESRLCQAKETVPRIIIFIRFKRNANQRRQRVLADTGGCLAQNHFLYLNPQPNCHTPNTHFLC